MIDPVTFEVLRHRLTMTIEEGALALRDTSGSPTVAQMGDCNVALLDAAGECVLVGRTIPDHATSCISTVRYIMQEYRENPGYGPGPFHEDTAPLRAAEARACATG